MSVKSGTRRRSYSETGAYHQPELIKRIKIEPEEENTDQIFLDYKGADPISCGQDYTREEFISGNRVVDKITDQSIQFSAQKSKNELTDGEDTYENVNRECNSEDKFQESELSRIPETNKQYCIMDFSIQDKSEGIQETNGVSHKSTSEPRFTPRIDLSLDLLDIFHSSICIKGKIFKKTQIREPDMIYPIKYFIFGIMDLSGFINVIVQGKICDQVFDILEVGEIYSFEKVTLNKDSNHETVYELSINKNSRIFISNDALLAKKTDHTRFIIVHEIQDMKIGSYIDFQGRITAIGDTHHLDIQNKVVPFCEITLNDYLDEQIQVILLDIHADNICSWEINQTMQIKKARIIKSGKQKNLLASIASCVECNS